MPLSGSWSTVPITGTYGDRNGVPVSGSVTFVAPAPVTVDGVLVVPTSFTATVTNGVLATTLPVTADPGTQYYTVLERLPYARQPFGIIVVYGGGSISLTSGAVGTAVQIVGPGSAVSLAASGPITSPDSSIVVGGTATLPTLSAAAAIAASAALLQPAQITAQAKTDYAKLLPWFAALANRTAARANVVVIGASVVEGEPVPTYAHTITQYMQTLLRARFPTPGVTGGRGYIGVPTAVVAGTGWPLAFTGGTFDDTVFSIGGKHRCWYVTAAGKAVDTLTGPVTSFDINHVASTSGGATTGYYKIDGGTAVTFSTLAGANTVTKTHVASPATSSIEVGWNAAGYFTLDGITEYNGDETAGIQVHNCGHAGYSSAQWNFGAGTGGWPYSIANLNPALVILQDHTVQDAWTGNGNLTAAQAKTSLQTLIATLRTYAVTCPILIAADYDVSGTLAMNQAWPLYVAAMQQVAAADPTVAFVDHSARMPASLGNPYSLYHTDLVHGNANGNAYQLIAETLVKAISPY